jgi:hypothetical protein
VVEPIDRANMNRFGAGLFGERNIAPLGYAAFGFVLGVTAGVLIRRTLPAMAATLGVFLGVRLAFTYLVRAHLMAPRHLTASLAAVTNGFGSTNGGPLNLFAGAPNLPNAWIYSTRIVDANGHELPSQVAASACPDLAAPPSGSVAGSGHAAPVHAPADAKRLADLCHETQLHLPRPRDLPARQPLLALPVLRDSDLPRRGRPARLALLLPDPPPRHLTAVATVDKYPRHRHHVPQLVWSWSRYADRDLP